MVTNYNIYYKKSLTSYYILNGNMVHISGFYNYVQVRTGQWETAFHQLGLTEGLCKQLSTEQWKSREGL